jgi:hypothetical protein
VYIYIVNTREAVLWKNDGQVGAADQGKLWEAEAAVGVGSCRDEPLTGGSFAITSAC